MPTASDLNEHYRHNYFDGQHTNYPGQYTVAEVEYLHFKDKVLEYFLNTNFSKSGKTLLDIGCGEGFTLNYFNRRGYSCYGADYAKQGIENEHPDLLQEIEFEQTNIVTGEYFKNEVFDVIVGNGILEHVIDKEKVLHSMRDKLTVGGCLFILVPNDFGTIHEIYMKENGLGMRECPWFVPPEHLTYFNADS